MDPQSGSPFESIESAHDFVTLLADAVAEARREIDSDIQRELTANSPRRLEAFRLASYSLEKLELHMSKSGRILNDLRSLRRLLFAERASAAKSGVPASLIKAAVATAVASEAVRTGPSRGANGGVIAA